MLFCAKITLSKYQKEESCVATTKQPNTSKATSMAELMARQSTQFESLKKGQIIKGTVKKLTPQEILLDIGYKSDGLVIEYDKQNLENLLSILKVGDTVSASVISPESEEGFPVLSLRRMLEDKVYASLEGFYQGNETFKAQIAESSRGGYFIQTAEGIKGFLPNSQLLNNKPNVGDTIEVKVIEFDREKKRIIISQKATKYVMNVAELEKIAKKNAKVKITVKFVTSYGIYGDIEFEKGKIAEGFIHISEVSHQRVEGLEGKFSIGQVLDGEVIDIDRENKRVNVSLKRLEKDTFDEVKEKYKAEQVVKAIVKDVKSRGITLEIEPGVMAFFSASKVPTGTTYAINNEVEVEVVDFDSRKRLVNVSPVLKSKFIGYR